MLVTASRCQEDASAEPCRTCGVMESASEGSAVSAVDDDEAKATLEMVAPTPPDELALHNMDVLSLLAESAEREGQLFPFALVSRGFRRAAHLATACPLRTSLTAVSTQSLLDWCVVQGAPPLWGRVAEQMELELHFSQEALRVKSLELQGFCL